MASRKDWTSSGASSPALELREPTPEEIEGLREAGKPRGMSGPDYLKFLSQFPPPTYEQLRNKPGPQGEPFRL